MKVLHHPTFLSTITSALQNHGQMTKSLEALMFSFCLAAVSVMDEDECQIMLGASQSLVFSQYHTATQQALVNAGYMSTSSLMTLQAFAIFTVNYCFYAPWAE
jgi:hypothetical protein